MVMETNVDDSSAELLGLDFQHDIFNHGAIDFYLTSILMKKGRPGLKLSILVDAKDLARVSDFVLEHSSSIGIRYYEVQRSILERRKVEVETPYGPVQVKQVITPSGAKRHKIEYDSLQKLKESHNISILRLQEELYPLITKILGHEKK